MQGILVHRRALIYYDLQEYKQCVQLIEQFIQTNASSDSHLYYLLGKAYLEMNMSDRALQAFLGCRESFDGKVRDLIEKLGDDTSRGL